MTDSEADSKSRKRLAIRVQTSHDSNSGRTYGSNDEPFGREFALCLELEPEGLAQDLLSADPYLKGLRVSLQVASSELSRTAKRCKGTEFLDLAGEDKRAWDMVTSQLTDMFVTSLMKTYSVVFAGGTAPRGFLDEARVATEGKPSYAEGRRLLIYFGNESYGMHSGPFWNRNEWGELDESHGEYSKRLNDSDDISSIDRYGLRMYQSILATGGMACGAFAAEEWQRAMSTDPASS